MARQTGLASGQFGKEKGDLTGGRFVGVRTVHQVFRRLDAEITPDRPRSGFGRVGDPHQRADHREGVLGAFYDHEQNGRAGEKRHEISEKRPFRVLGVVCLCQLACDRPQFGRDQSEVLALQATDYLSDEPALDTVGLHNDKGAIHERRRVAAARRTQGPGIAKALKLQLLLQLITSGTR